MLKIKRALLTVSDKKGLIELAGALAATGTELVATGRTAQVLIEVGLVIVPIEKISGSPEAFQGRMKTLSFPVCSGILARRGDAGDDQDLKNLKISLIDCVVVNFYPFEAASAKPGITERELIEEVDIGGPTLVRAAAKNSPDVLVLTSPHQYSAAIAELNSLGGISPQLAGVCAAQAWDKVLEYDQAIAARLGSKKSKGLRYGENPHQSGRLEFDPQGPIQWDEALTPTELSYNNILDVSSGYALASDLESLGQDRFTGVVILKHNNPCGVAMVPRSTPDAQKVALDLAWAGDPVSAFGGVLLFTDPIEDSVAEILSTRFIELVAAPELRSSSSALKILMAKRKNLKALRVNRWGDVPREAVAIVPGGRLVQQSDTGLDAELRGVTRALFPNERKLLAQFGIVINRVLKSNAICLVRETPQFPGAFQLVGAGQGQPNRIDAIEKLGIPRAAQVLEKDSGTLADCLLVSDAFFPFRDAVDSAHAGGIRFIVQPGGSIKDPEVIAACDDAGIAMAFTGVRHFKH